MPIRPELRHLYRGPAWRATRERILARAKNACEQCRKPNGQRVYTLTGNNAAKGVRAPYMFWARRNGRTWVNHHGKPQRVIWSCIPRQVYVVLTLAHLNHVAGDDRDENLKALCQWCHLHYDQLHHRETRSARKDAARPILKAAESEAAHG